MRRLNLAITYLFCFVGSAAAATLQVQVYQRGQPAEGANVCVGTYQERGLYYLTKTNDKGYVLLNDLPEGRIVITAEQNGYGKDEIITNSSYSKSVMLALPQEKGGPGCPQINYPAD